MNNNEKYGLEKNEEVIFCKREDDIVFCLIRTYVGEEPVLRVFMGTITNEDKVDGVYMDLDFADAYALSGIIFDVAREMMYEKRTIVQYKCAKKDHGEGRNNNIYVR